MVQWLRTGRRARARESDVSWLVRAVHAVWDFVVGDDPFTALGVVVALAARRSSPAPGAPAWWVMPAAVLVLLALSLRRATR